VAHKCSLFYKKKGCYLVERCLSINGLIVKSAAVAAEVRPRLAFGGMKRISGNAVSKKSIPSVVCGIHPHPHHQSKWVE
jgi:hypothetical protein